MTDLGDQPMKLLIFGIAIVTLGAISQAKAAPIEFGEAKLYPRLVEGKAFLRPWELDNLAATMLCYPPRHHVRYHHLTIDLYLLMYEHRAF